MTRTERLLLPLLFLAALLPRALSGHFLTIDEAYHWFGRVADFGAALARGDFAGTNLIGHPGVTTLWLGWIGARAADALGAADGEARRGLIRLPIAVATSACVALALPPLRRLLGPRAAWLAAILWAGEPFLVAHSQLLHLDALLTSFVTLSLVVLLDGAARGELLAPPRLRTLAASGALLGLALLTKSPSVLLLPVAGLVLLAAAWPGSPGRLAPFLASLRQYAAWLAAAAIVWVALWPAAWVAPLQAAGRVLLQAEADGGSPHGWGNYFLGRAVSDPGPLFYPVAVAMRLAPWTLAGCLLLAGLAARDARRGGRAWWAALVRTPRGLALAALAGFALTFALAMSVPPKKFDRYALPIFPALDILAAAGLARGAEALLGRIRAPRARARAAAGAWALAAALPAATLAFYHPYELAFFDPLLGGGAAAAWALPVGWGEGYEQAGAFIAAQPNGADHPAAALYAPALDPYAPAGAAPMEWAYQPGRVDYAVLYIDQIQRGFKAQLVEGLLGRVRPVHTVVIHGIEYAYVYQVAPPVAHPREAAFGDSIRLLGYDLDQGAVRAGGGITLTLDWEGAARPPADYTLFVHVLDSAGSRVAQADVPPGGPRWPTSRWDTGRFVWIAQHIPLPADLPPGRYRIAVGLYDPRDFSRLPLRAPPGEAEPAAGGDALLLTSFDLP